MANANRSIQRRDDETEIADPVATTLELTAVQRTAIVISLGSQIQATVKTCSQTCPFNKAVYLNVFLQGM